MSREDVARAALRSLASPTMKGGEEIAHFNSAGMTGQAPTYQHYHVMGPNASPASHTSFFGNGGSTQITDSPTSSPSLAAVQSSPQPFQDSFGPPSRPTFSRRPTRRDTPSTSEVPSLSLSNSSVSDSYLLSPYHEVPPSQTASMSSMRTVQGPHQESSSSPRQQRRLEAMRRAAAALRMPVEDIQRGLELVDRVKEEKDEEQVKMEEEDVNHIDRKMLSRISDAVRSEEERLVQIASFRAAYVQAESMRPNIELQHRPQHQQQHQQPHQQSQPQMYPQQRHQQQYQARRRAHREGVIGLPTSRTMPPLSPPPSYDQLEILEPEQYSPGVIPSPREALNSLSGGRQSQAYEGSSPYNQRYGSVAGQGPAYLHPTTSQHTRRPSGTRPLSLPDRSYRSMDDYVANDPFSPSSARNSGASYLRRSVQAPYPPPTLSRTTSRSPLVTDSPHLLGAETGTEFGAAALSPFLSSNRLTPGVHGPQRKRSGSGTSNRSSVVSRRASTDVLGLGIPRSASPSNEGPKLSHEEVMARLQRKVKERIAAREATAGSGSSVAGELSAASVPTSPAVPISSLGSTTPSGRRRQDSASGHTPSSSHRSSSNSRQRKPRKAASLKTLPQHHRGSEDDEKPLPPLPPPSLVDTPSAERQSPADGRGGNNGYGMDGDHSVGAKPGDEEDRMSGVEQEFDADASSGRLGIETLLSAAAIADSPRMT